MNEHEVASQHITVTVALADSQDVTIDTHGTDGPGSHLSVAYACVLIWLYDLRAVTTYGRVWSETAASIRGPTAANTGAERAAGRRVLAHHRDRSA